MTDVPIRLATADDVPAIQRVAGRCWEATYADFLSQETIDAALDAWYGADEIRESIDEAETAYLVATEGGELGDEVGELGDEVGEVVGYVYGGPTDAGTAALSMLYVDPDRWGQGIGTALLDAFEDCCRDWGRDTVDVEVLAENEVGLSFYRKHGYEVLGEGESDLFGETVRGCLVRGELG